MTIGCTCEVRSGSLFGVTETSIVKRRSKKSRSGLEQNC